MSNYFSKGIQEILEELGSSVDGLSAESVDINREKYGLNVLVKKKRFNYFTLLFSQFNNLFNYVLMSSAIIFYLLGDTINFFVILVVVFLNITIGFVQEGRAQKVFEALENSIKSKATVVRGSRRQIIQDTELVVGDIILLSPGDKIPADARIIDMSGLKMNEASLTGESDTVLKTVAAFDKNEIQVSEQTNMVFKGTFVGTGTGRAIVVAIGNKTEIGKIASQITELDEGLPIKSKIENLSKLIFFIVIILSLITFISGIAQGLVAKELFLIVVALFVSAVPESLPMILTVVLATGFYRMSKKNVLVKKLQAVEALGQTDIVALDKTGTITKNQMKVERVFANDKFYYISGDGYEPKGKIICGEEPVDLFQDEAMQLMLKISASTSIGSFSFDEKTEQWIATFGDPTEVAMLVFAEKFGVEKDEMIREYPVIREIPFDRTYKYHATIHDVESEQHLYVSGSPEVILKKSTKILKNGKIIDLSDTDIERLEEALGDLTSKGYRVLANAFKKDKNIEFKDNDLPEVVFVGFVGINDTIRKTVPDSLKALANAGIKAVIITGDHKDTAIGIAKQIGLYGPKDLAITGEEMEAMNDYQLLAKIEDTTVFARLSPEQKLKIINLYKKKGHIVAMTGDGVNDALSLVRADLGVAMGFGATDVAQESADIILLDNNFGNIGYGVLEGRNIYINIKKTVEYLLSTNIAELIVVVFSVLFGLPLVLTAVQILWLNLVTDTFLVVGFAFEPIDKSLGNKKSWKPSKYLVNKDSVFKIITIASVMTVVTLLAFFKYIPVDLVTAQTMALAVITVLQFYNVYNIKSGNESIFKVKIFNNLYLLGGIVASASAFLFAMYNPFMQGILGIKPIAFGDWLYVILIGLVLVAAEEIRKLIFSKNL